MTERPAILMKRDGETLKPCSAMDAEAVREFGSDKAVRVRISQPRNVGQLRLYFAVLRIVCDNLDTVLTVEALHSWLKVKAGLVEAIPLRNGQTEFAPASVSFASMEQERFAEYFNAAMDILIGRVIPGLGKGALMAEAKALLGES